MDSFVIVLFILVLFAIFICFKNRNNETIIEGFEGPDELTEEEELYDSPQIATADQEESEET